ncbi:hypothetical protein O181_069349 [Austropuccinia psidii MF-1]|uniref:Uncharacterized protein n=1 Tax=Austropuccinia psidii MF-1 TaxID=1389203 RepID=A0A9Q3EYQ2_9BASI|nr:hypothetical protein [Austropuccinia psidii MF-1]
MSSLILSCLLLPSHLLDLLDLLHRHLLLTLLPNQINHHHQNHHQNHQNHYRNQNHHYRNQNHQNHPSFHLNLFLSFYSQFILAFSVSLTQSQSISTNMALPPMEWIKLNPIGSSSPPPLAHACLIGPTFDSQSNSNSNSNSPTTDHLAYLFGGRSSSGISSNEIYILDYSSPSSQPTWSQPTPSSSTIFTSKPQQRSHSICSWDSASNFRNQLNLYGGRSQDGQALNDFWFYDPINHFWSQPTSFSPNSPTSIYGQIGGSDPNYTPSPPNTANSIIIIAGSNSQNSNIPLEPMAFSIDGQLGSNTNTIKVNLTNLKSTLTGNPSNNNLSTGRWGAAGTTLPGWKTVLFSGCDTDPINEFHQPTDSSCALLNGGILKFQSDFSPQSLINSNNHPISSSWTPFNYCPAPRIGGIMVPNRNRFDSSFTNQVILIGGTIDHHNWNDQGGSDLGEVAILDTASGTWARVLPTLPKNLTFTPKTGLIALALSSPINGVNSPPQGTTDILVYGGLDLKTGQASNELWVLRLYPAKLTGNGTSNGISLSYLPNCVLPTSVNQKTLNNNNNNHNNNNNDNSSEFQSSQSISSNDLETSSAHIYFTTISLIIIMCSLTILRLEEPGKLSFKRRWRTFKLWFLISAWYFLSLGSLILALAIFIGLTQTRLHPQTQHTLFKRHFYKGNSNHLKLSITQILSSSTHAKLGLIIGGIGLIIVPTLYILSWLSEILENRKKKREPIAGIPRRLKVKKTHALQRTKKAIENSLDLLFWFNSPFRHHHHSNQNLKSNQKSINQSSPIMSNKLNDIREKTLDLNDINDPQSSPNSSTGDPYPDPIITPALTHDRIGSTSTTYTNTELLLKKGFFSSEPQPHHQSQIIIPTPIENSCSSTSKLKHHSSFTQTIHNLSHSLFGSPKSNEKIIGNKKHNRSSSSPLQTPLPPPLPTPSLPTLPLSPKTGSSFEVLNRVGARQRGGIPMTNRSRMSLDLISNSSSHRRALSGSLRGEDGDYHVENYQVDEIEEEEEDDDDDSQHRTVKARRKLRRLSDVMLHGVLLVANVYLITTFFISGNHKWLGGLFSGLCFSCYLIMGWLAWHGKPSEESTLVIFFSIIKNGQSRSKDGNRFFSSVVQQQQQHQQVAQLPGSVGAQSLMTSKVNQTPSLFSGSQSQYHQRFFQNEMGIRLNGEIRSETSEHSNNLGIVRNSVGPNGGMIWTGSEIGLDGDEDEEIREENDEGYLSQREIQIITTAPKRKLAVVNG